MTPFRTIKLACPLVTTDGVKTELTIRRARPGDASTFARIEALSCDPVVKMGQLIDALAGLPSGSAVNLDWDDFVVASEAAAAVMHGMAATVRGRRR